MTLRNAHHLGRIGHFAEMAVAQDLVSLHFVNVLSRPVVAPWGGADGRYGTNPCCIGIPLAGREPVTTSLTSQVQHREGDRHRKGDRHRHGDRRHDGHRHHYVPGRHYHRAPHGWHRHGHRRPHDWHTRGCIVVGAIWFCP